MLQGPLPHTVADFWRMAVECEVQVIVMACNQTEAGKVSPLRLILPFNLYFRRPNRSKVTGDIPLQTSNSNTHLNVKNVS